MEGDDEELPDGVEEAGRHIERQAANINAAVRNLRDQGIEAMPDYLGVEGLTASDVAGLVGPAVRFHVWPNGEVSAIRVYWRTSDD